MICERGKWFLVVGLIVFALATIALIAAPLLISNHHEAGNVVGCIMCLALIIIGGLFVTEWCC